VYAERDKRASFEQRLEVLGGHKGKDNIEWSGVE
jgi:hypothetical protein